MSDEDYSAFLNKSSKDYSKPSTAQPSAASRGISSKAHPAIAALGERFYTSDADEPFEDVSFDWTGSSMPSEGDFSKLVSTDASNIETLTPSKWDPRNQYKDVIEAVEYAAEGRKAKVYRVADAGSRAVYYVLSLSEENGLLVGVQAKAVES